MKTCPECGYQIGPHIRLCPNCGTLLEASAEQAQPQPAAPPPPRRRLSVLSLLMAAFAVLMVGLVAISSVTGFQAGLRDRELQAQRDLDRHYQRGLAHLAASENELAAAEFEYVLQLYPEYPGARDKLAETRRRLTVVPTPTTSEVVTHATGELYEQALEAYQAQDWPLAVERLRQVRAVDLAYEAAAVEDSLFTAALTYGLQLLETDRLEEGLYYLDLASELRPLGPDVLYQHQLAAMYLTARGYWGVDWQVAIERFDELYRIAPGYKDVYARLVEAHVSYGDHYSNTFDFCPAEQKYADALKLQLDPSVEARRSYAAQRCAQATPVPVSGTLTVSGTIVPIEGLSSGRLAYPVYNARTGLYDTYVLFAAENRMLKAITGGDQPAWRPGAPELAYRVAGVGINVYNMAADEDRRVVNNATATWPCWSPDGTRLAYSAKDSSDNWRVYIIPADGSQEARVVAAGWAPLWGSAGALAYTGCGAGGVCGLFIIYPDQSGTPPRKMTDNRDDTAMAWSPDGQNLAYMSSHSGNWDAYVLNLSGGIVQLTVDPAEDGWPAWAPDGSGVLFASKRSGKWGLWLMGIDGSNQRLALVLSERSPNWTDERLAWSP